MRTAHFPYRAALNIENIPKEKINICLTSEACPFLVCSESYWGIPVKNLSTKMCSIFFFFFFLLGSYLKKAFQWGKILETSFMHQKREYDSTYFQNTGFKLTYHDSRHIIQVLNKNKLLSSCCKLLFLSLETMYMKGLWNM